VHKSRAPDEYRAPVHFFQKIYRTEGLSPLLDVVARRLCGEDGDPVIQIQTPFGGGKTHALIAMYHKAAEWDANQGVYPELGACTERGTTSRRSEGCLHFDRLSTPLVRRWICPTPIF